MGLDSLNNFSGFGGKGDFQLSDNWPSSDSGKEDRVLDSRSLVKGGWCDKDLGLVGLHIKGVLAGKLFAISRI